MLNAGVVGPIPNYYIRLVELNGHRYYSSDLPIEGYIRSWIGENYVFIR